MRKLTVILASACLAASVFLLPSCSKDDTTSTPVALPTPTGVTCTSTKASLSFTWPAITGAASYSYEFRDADLALISGSVTTPEWLKENLNFESDYTFRLKAVPAEGSKTSLESAWSEWATYTTSEGEVARRFASGSGTEADPYIIKTPAQLAYLAQVVNEEVEGLCEWGVFYELGNDIDLKDYENWEPIGAATGSRTINVNPDIIVKAFHGNFSGAYHTIKNLNVSVSGNGDEIHAGLFGLSNGVIKYLNVEGTVVGRSNHTDGGNLLVGGVVGLSAIAYDPLDQLNVLTPSGGIVHCTFKGSVTADSNMDTKGRAAAGGICGYVESGNVDYCEVTVESGKAIHAIAGASSMAGGISGFQFAGRTSFNNATIAGDIIAEFLDTTTDRSGEGPFAGGVLGSSGRLQDSYGAPGAASCAVTVSGSIKAIGSTGSDACAGGFAGASNVDLTALCTAEISGLVYAEGYGSVGVGGITGKLLGNLGGSNQFQVCSTHITSTGEIKLAQKNAASTTAIGIGGITGILGGSADDINNMVVKCKTVLDGKITVINDSTFGPTAPTTGSGTYCSGISGQLSKSSYNNCFIMNSGAVIEASGKALNIGGCVGFFFGGAATKKYYANYSHMGGTIKTHPAAAGANYWVYAGGVMGAVKGGAAAGTPIYSCYSVFNSALETEATATVIKGAFGGNVPNRTTIPKDLNTVTSCYWASTVEGMIGRGGASTGVEAFASLDRAGYEAAMAVMNQTMVDKDADTASAYTYDSEKGYLVIQ